MVKHRTLTGENGGHECAEQDKHEGEEELGGVVVHVFGFVSDVIVQTTDEDAEQNVRDETGHCQHLKHKHTTGIKCDIS